MIVSIHISKTAGTTFGTLLRNRFGKRFLADYGDWMGAESPAAVAWREERRRKMRGRRRELLRKYDVIHGHFIADKYAGLFPQPEFVTFFRDPYQQTVSSYEYAARHPEINHPVVKKVHEQKMGLVEYMRLVAQPQCAFMGNLPLEDLAFVGLTERFDESVGLFNAMFGTSLVPDTYENVNPQRSGLDYEISPDIRREIARHRDADIELYERAKDVFARQLAQRTYG